jgi:hypothetical protein
VRHTLLVSGEPGSTPAQTPVTVGAMNIARYAGMIAGTPLPQVPAGLRAWPGGRGPEGQAAAPGRLPVPVLASPAAASVLGRGPATVTLDTGLAVRVRVAGTIAIAQEAMISGPWVILPQQAAARLHLAPRLMLVTGSGLDGAALGSTVARVLPGASLSLRQAALASLTQAPLSRAGYIAFAEGGGAAAAFCVIILLIGLILGARPRELTMARLATMGMSGGQARWLAAAEVAPAILAAAIGGIACAWALVPLVGPSLDLSVFTAAAQAVPVPVGAGLVTVAAAAAGLLAVAIVTLAGQVLMAGRRGAARALRAGE